MSQLRQLLIYHAETIIETLGESWLEEAEKVCDELDIKSLSKQERRLLDNDCRKLQRVLST